MWTNDKAVSGMYPKSFNVYNFSTQKLKTQMIACDVVTMCGSRSVVGQISASFSHFTNLVQLVEPKMTMYFCS